MEISYTARSVDEVRGASQLALKFMKDRRPVCGILQNNLCIGVLGCVGRICCAGRVSVVNRVSHGLSHVSAELAGVACGLSVALLLLVVLLVLVLSAVIDGSPPEFPTWSSKFPTPPLCSSQLDLSAVPSCP